MNKKIYHVLILSMIILFTTISALLYSQENNNKSCDFFYKKSAFKRITINKKVIIEIKDNPKEISYQITYEEGYNIKKTISIYKNPYGLSLKSSIKPGDMIKKEKNDMKVTIANVYKNNLSIRVFNLSCD